jgi:hypothetical protein
MRKAILFGDSLTAGRIGISYRRYIPVATEAHGIEGDTWSLTVNRLRRYLAKRSPGREITMVLESGANDLLLPFMAQNHASWKQATVQLNTTSQKPIEEHDAFIEQCSMDLKELSELVGHASLMVCSIPILGEQLDSPLNRERDRRNGSMRDIVEQYENLLWCDITQAVEAFVREQGGSSPYLPEHPQDIERDVARIGTDEVKASHVSEERDLVATIDGVHPNGAGAQLIGSAITTMLPW